MKILVAIESCADHRRYHQAQRDTWIKDLPKEVSYRFFMGGSSESYYVGEPWFRFDEVCLNVDDSYRGLALKTREICRWAYDAGYDFLFKTDTDTVISVSRLLTSDFASHDYLGGENADNLPAEVGPGRIEFASGGAGYWLSKKAMSIVSRGRPEACGEDVYAALMLREQGIQPVWNQGYRWKPGATTDSAISFHLSSALQKKYTPELMYEYYQKMLDTTPRT